jgi:hydroxymethylbilane synthase
MTMQNDELRLGTRGSQLARAQSGLVARAVTRATGVSVRLVIIKTRGDRIIDRPLAEIGGKGLFTAELEAALRAHEIDFAVHSLKDLPTDDPAGLVLAAIPEREDPRDVLVGGALDALPRGAVVGTGSLRRGCQLRALRPDLEIRGIRGNVDTRLRKRDDGDYDAVVLAAAGLARLGIRRGDAYALAPDQMVPAVGQGALAIQAAADRPDVLALLAHINHPETRRRIDAERAFLAAFGGGCNVAAGCYARIEGGETLHVRAMAQLEDDGPIVRAAARGDDPFALGAELARVLRAS